MNDHTRAVIDAARKTAGAYDAESVSGLEEAQMAEAIGRLAGTLDMLIAAVEQPASVS